MIIIIKALSPKKGQKKERPIEKKKEKGKKEEKEEKKEKKRGNVTISFSTLVLQSSTLSFM